MIAPEIFLAASLLLKWDFPRAYQPQPERFVITMETEGVTDTLSVLPSPGGACDEPNPDTYCARMPTCPPDGIYTFTVVAAWGTVQSGGAEAVCMFTVLMPCHCLTIQPPPQTAAEVQMLITQATTEAHEQAAAALRAPPASPPVLPPWAPPPPRAPV